MVKVGHAGIANSTRRLQSMILCCRSRREGFVVLSLCPMSLPAGKSCTNIVTFVAGPFFNPQTATLNVMDSLPEARSKLA